MNIKLALASLLVGVVMSCGVSQGQLLDRMLSKAGCSSCGTASGCSGGLLSGGCGSAESCGLGLCDKIKSRLAGGCGCAAPASDCGCEEAPVVMESSCGCESAAPVDSCGCGGAKLLQNLRSRYDGGGCGCDAAPAPVADCGCEAAPVPVADCGCDAAPAPVADCGCEAAPAPVADCGCSAAPAPVADCGCDAAPAIGGCKLMGRLQGKLSSLGNAGGCGCDAAPALPSVSYEPSPAPVFEAAPVSSCGCGSAAPAIGGGSLLDRLKGKMSSLGNGGGCGCDAAPVQSGCGCDAAPVVTPVVESSCGCSAAPAPAPAASCGCGSAAPAESSCGCAGSSSRPKLTLMDRLRGNRIARDRDGRVIGGGCNDGCNPPCPQADTGCGCGGEMAYEPAPAAPVVDSGCSSCSSCGSSAYQGEVLAAPLAGTVIYSDGSGTRESVITEGAAPVSEAVSPVEPAEATDVIEEALPKTDATPEVDPNAFIAPKGQATS